MEVIRLSGRKIMNTSFDCLGIAVGVDHGGNGTYKYQDDMGRCQKKK